jgi:hypothetical protein
MSSVREYAVLYLGGVGKKSGGSTGGGNVVLTAGPHILDGVEHSTAADSTRLDASATAHGLMWKLSGDGGDGFMGDGSWVHAVTEDDVIALITPDVYACASLTVIAAKGSIAAGAHTDLHAVGGTTVQVNETATTPGFNVEAAFTGVDGITNLYLHGYYSASHTVTVELYNYDTTSWDVAITIPTSGTKMELLSASIAVGTPYFDGGGNAVVRFYHAAAGTPTHRLYLDYLALSHAVSTGGALALDGLSDVNAPAPNNGDVLTWDSTPGEWVPVAPGAGSGDTVGQIIAGWDGGGAEIEVGTQVDVVAPFAGTITGWTLLADQTGDAVVDVWVEQLVSYPPTNADSITAAAPPTLTADTDVTSTAVGTWTAAITAGDIIRFNLDSVTDCTRLLCVLDYTRP